MLINVFSPFWFIMFGIDAVLLVVLSTWLRKKPVDVKGRVMTIIAIANCAVWIIYKILLSTDPDYDFVLATEFPFQLCNMNMIFILIAIKTRKPGLLNFCFCFGIPVGSDLSYLV